MELHEFKEQVADLAALLKAIQKLIPRRVDAELVAYLEFVQADPCGLEVLRNAIASGPRS